jgi:ATP-dependent DNA helicase RecG
MKLTQLKGISEKKEALFFKLGLCTVEDLISFFPKSYMDLSQITTLDEAILKEKEERILVCIEVVSIARIPNKRNLSFIRVKIKDSFATAYLNIFGDQPYYRKIFKEGKKFLLSGLFRFQNGKIECSQFSVEKALEDVADISNYNLKDDLQSLHYQRIVPIYSLTPGLTQKFLRESIFGALDKMKERLSENLPAYLTQKYKFIKRDEAFKEIHFPTSFEKLEQAKKRFKYYELFKLQFQFGLKRHYFKAMGAKSQKYLNKKELYHKVIESLPFKLTSSQIKALEEIHTDLYKDSSMHRLLLGDVGSGKTLVAILSALTVIESGYQAVFLVPTEALAYQHFLTVMKLFSPFFINVRLLTGSTKSGEKKEILKDLNNNECSFLIGTHAVFTHDVEYKNLALIIIDEQHKFGVNQRAKLVEKTFTPDLLIMSATPIPRTLGYSIFGDLDISRLNEKPQGRETIQTFWYTKDSINEVYTFIQKQIEKGHQGYMVYPLIEESETTDLNSLLNSYEQLKKGPSLFFFFRDPSWKNDRRR